MRLEISLRDKYSFCDSVMLNDYHPVTHLKEYIHPSGPSRELAVQEIGGRGTAKVLGRWGEREEKAVWEVCLKHEGLPRRVGMARAEQQPSVRTLGAWKREF